MTSVGATGAEAQHFGVLPVTLMGVGAVTGQEPPPPWRKQIALQFPWVRSQAALNFNFRASPPDLVVFWASHMTWTFTLFASVHLYAFSLTDLFFKLNYGVYLLKNLETDLSRKKLGHWGLWPWLWVTMSWLFYLNNKKARERNYAKVFFFLKWKCYCQKMVLMIKL